jgi:hypothetical protein
MQLLSQALSLLQDETKRDLLSGKPAVIVRVTIMSQLHSLRLRAAFALMRVEKTAIPVHSITKPSARADP